MYWKWEHIARTICAMPFSHPKTYSVNFWSLTATPASKKPGRTYRITNNHDFSNASCVQRESLSLSVQIGDESECGAFHHIWNCERHCNIECIYNQINTLGPLMDRERDAYACMFVYSFRIFAIGEHWRAKRFTGRIGHGELTL